jgi:hypothetical protein
MNRFFSDYLARYNKREVTTGVISLVLGTGIALANSNFAYNALCGPFPVTGEELAKFKSSALFQKYFVLVKGQEVIHTGLAWQRTRTRSKKESDSNVDRSDETPEYYMDVLLVDNLLLPIKTVTLTENPVIIGELKPPDKSVIDLLRGQTSKKAIADKVLNVQLEQSDSFKATFWILLFFVGGLGLFGLFKAYNALFVMKDLEKHPLGKAIARTGGFNSMRIEIDQDFEHVPPADSGKKVVCGKKWILIEEMGLPKFIPFKNVVWVYASNSPTRSFMVTTDVYSIIICTTDGAENKIAMPKNEADPVLLEISKNAPWAMLGFEGQRALRWNAHKQKLIAEIEQTRDQLIRKS